MRSLFLVAAVLFLSIPEAHAQSSELSWTLTALYQDGEHELNVTISREPACDPRSDARRCYRATVSVDRELDPTEGNVICMELVSYLERRGTVTAPTLESFARDVLEGHFIQWFGHAPSSRDISVRLRGR